jgi:hypothetical protein
VALDHLGELRWELRDWRLAARSDIAFEDLPPKRCDPVEVAVDHVALEHFLAEDVGDAPVYHGLDAR